MFWQPKLRSHLAEMCSQYVLTLQQQNGTHTHSLRSSQRFAKMTFSNGNATVQNRKVTALEH
jgi:hypothetical protein